MNRKKVKELEELKLDIIQLMEDKDNYNKLMDRVLSEAYCIDGRTEARLHNMSISYDVFNQYINIMIAEKGVRVKELQSELK